MLVESILLKRHRYIRGCLAFTILAVDILGYYYSPEVFRQWMRSYGHDVALPMFLYFVIRTTWQKHANTRLLVSLCVSAGCIVFELAQIIGLYPGTFDPIDFVFYGFAIVLAIVVDMFCVREGKINNGSPQQG